MACQIPDKVSFGFQEPEKNAVSSAGTSLNLFGCSPDDRRVDSFQFLPIVNKIVMDITVQFFA